MRIAAQSAGRALGIALQLNHLLQRLSQLLSFNLVVGANDLNRHVGRRHPHQVAGHRALVFYVFFFLSPLYFEQWGLGDVDIPLLNQRRHLTIKESQQQRADVRAVDVGVGHQNYLVVAKLGSVKVFLTDTRAERGD